MSKQDYKITKQDWESVKTIMEQYHRKDGWVDITITKAGNYRLTFFDSNPKIDNVDALYITKYEVDLYAK